MSEGVDRVRVVTEGGAVIPISAASRQAIAEELRRFQKRSPGEEVTMPARRAFEAAGANGPVKLDRQAGASVIDAINSLEARAGGPYSYFAADLVELRDTLVGEF